jgi:hypothetical protein
MRLSAVLIRGMPERFIGRPLVATPFWESTTSVPELAWNVPNRRSDDGQGKEYFRR